MYSSYSLSGGMSNMLSEIGSSSTNASRSWGQRKKERKEEEEGKKSKMMNKARRRRQEEEGKEKRVGIA
jgi:hypothetical protein